MHFHTIFKELTKLMSGVQPSKCSDKRWPIPDLMQVCPAFPHSRLFTFIHSSRHSSTVTSYWKSVIVCNLSTVKSTLWSASTFTAFGFFGFSFGTPQFGWAMRPKCAGTISSRWKFPDSFAVGRPYRGVPGSTTALTDCQSRPASA